MPVSNRRSRVVRGSSALRRRTAWATSNVLPTTLASGAKANIDLLAAFEVGGASTLGCTIARVHSAITLSWSTTDANPGFFGGYIVSSAPALSGMIDPSTELKLDWMLLRTLVPGEGISVVQLPWTTPTAVTTTFHNDIRSKRKMRQMGEKFFLCLTNPGAATVTYSTFTRTLVMLP